MEEFDDDQTFSINFAQVSKEKSLLSITRLLAVNMMANPYITVGEFLKDIGDSDLDTIGDIIDAGEEHENFSDLMLISEMLAVGEGLPQGTVDVMHSRVNMFLTFITCEMLGRKGLIQVVRENMSFGEDMASAIVAKKLDDNDVDL